MRKNIYKIALVVALGCSFALAQNMPRRDQPQYPQTQDPKAQPQSNSEQTKMAASSTDVQNDIQSALQKEPTLTGANINVQVTDKNVELSGTVPSKEAKTTAEQIAKAHSGGLMVKSHLKVGETGSTSPGAADKHK
jgi:BON domain-containing protein